MKVAKAIIIVLLFFFALTFCIQNADEVTLRYYGFIENVTAPIFIVVLASVFLGLVIGIVGGGLTTLRLRIQLRRQTKEAEALRQELDATKDEEGAEP
ncbi:MAG: LapA family protein [Desulfobacterales bacterium]|nr:LapA family protein [Desulfobacterales bacterium]